MVIVPSAHVAGAFVPIEVIPITVAGILYWHRAMVLHWDGRPVPTWRQICFGSGLLRDRDRALQPDRPHLRGARHRPHGRAPADRRIATLLLVLGLTRSLLQPVLAIPFFNRLQVLTHPAVAFPLSAANLFFWHIPAIYQDAYGTAPLHALEHSTFLFFGCLMWMPVFGPLPKPEWFGAGWKVAYVIAVRFTGAILGNVLMWSGSVLYPIYAPGERYWGISALADQSTAGR